MLARDLEVLVQDAMRRIESHAFTPAQTAALTRKLIARGVAGEYQDYIAAEQCVMGIGALLAAWHDMQAFEAKTSTLVAEAMASLYDSVNNDESFDPGAFARVLKNLGEGLPGQ